MLCLDNTDVIEGGASVDNVIDYTIHGLVGTAFTQLAAGVLSDVLTAALYTAPAAVSVVNITLVNTHIAAVEITLRLDPVDGGNPRYIIPKTVTLGAGYSLHTDGTRINIMSASGVLVTGSPNPIATDIIWDIAGDTVYGTGANTAARLAAGAANLKMFMNAAGTAPEWASGTKIGYTTKNTADATGTQAITGVGFKPSHIIIIAGIDATQKLSIGFDNSSTIRGCYFDRHSYGADTIGLNSDNSLFLADSPNIYRGRLNSFDSDGFTIGWTKESSPTGTARIFYIVFR